MPLRNARTAAALASSSNCIWISDQLLTEAFERFSTICLSSRSLSSTTCRRIPPRNSPPLRATLRPRDTLPTCPVKIGAHNSSAKSHSHRRHVHNIPGPLEHRRRSARRRLNHAAAGVQAGAGPVFDPGFLLSNVWNTPKQPYWEWQPPIRHVNPLDGKQQPQLPEWLTHGLNYPFEKKLDPPLAPEHIAEEDISVEKFQASLVDLRDIQDVRRRYDDLGAVRLTDPSYAVAAFEHLVNAIPSGLENDGFDDKQLASDLLVFTNGSGHRNAILDSLASMTIGLEVVDISPAGAQFILALFETTTRQGVIPTKYALPLVKALMTVIDHAGCSETSNLATCDALLGRVVSQESNDLFDDLIELMRDSKSHIMLAVISKHVVIRLAQDAGGHDHIEPLPTTRLNRILQLLRIINRRSAEGETANMLCDTHARMLNLYALPPFERSPCMSLDLLGLCRLRSSMGDLSQHLLRLAREVIAGFDSFEHDTQRRALSSLNQYAQLALRSKVSTEADNADTHLAPQLVTQLLNQAPGPLAHAWFLCTSESLINVYKKTGSSDVVDSLRRWLTWVALSEQIVERQRLVSDNGVQNIYARLLAEFEPSDIPAALAILTPHQASQVLIRHYLVRKDLRVKSKILFVQELSRNRDVWWHTGPEVLQKPAPALEILAEHFEEHYQRLRAQLTRHTLSVHEDSTLAYMPFRRPIDTGVYSFGELEVKDERVLLSKPDLLNTKAGIHKNTPPAVLPYVSLLASMQAIGLSDDVLAHTLAELIRFLDAAGYRQQISHFILTTRAHIRMPTSPEITELIENHIRQYSQYWPHELLGLFNKSRQLSFGNAPNLIENLIASNSSQLHPRQILPLFSYLERDTLSPEEVSQLASDAPANRPLSILLTNQIHDAALVFARASRFSANAAFTCITSLYDQLMDHTATMDSRISRALVIAGILRPMHEGTCFKIPPSRFNWILSVVRDIEGAEVADAIDEMARQAEVREGQAQMRERSSRPKSVRVNFARQAGLDVGPRLSDFTGEERELDNRIGWKQKRKARELAAGVYALKKFGEEGERVKGRWKGLRYI